MKIQTAAIAAAARTQVRALGGDNSRVAVELNARGGGHASAELPQRFLALLALHHQAGRGVVVADGIIGCGDERGPSLDGKGVAVAPEGCAPAMRGGKRHPVPNFHGDGMDITPQIIDIRCFRHLGIEEDNLGRARDSIPGELFDVRHAIDGGGDDRHVIRGYELQRRGNVRPVAVGGEHRLTVLHRQGGRLAQNSAARAIENPIAGARGSEAVALRSFNIRVREGLRICGGLQPGDINRAVAVEGDGVVHGLSDHGRTQDDIRIRHRHARGP